MRGVVLPLVLLFLALGLALGPAGPRVWRSAVIVLVSSLTVFSFLPLSPGSTETVYFGCWISVMATAATSYLRHPLGRATLLALTVNAGLWAGAMSSMQGSINAMLEAVPAVLVVWPASWLVGRPAFIAVKVLSSWIIAIAALAATLQLLPVEPGYLPDHLE